MTGHLRKFWFRRGTARIVLAGAVLCILAVLGFLAPVLPIPDPMHQDLLNSLQQPFHSAGTPLGTDDLGRDTLSRVIWGLRPTLLISLVSALAATILGVVLGLLAVYAPAVVRSLADAILDVALTFPGFVLAIALVSVLGTNALSLTIAVSLTSLGMVGRLARGEVLRVRGTEFVTAARALGASWRRIALRHIIPNILNAIVVQFSLVVSVAMLTIAALGFIGLGIQPPNPELGTMVSNGSRYMSTDQALIIVPGLVLSILILSLNILGDGLRDRLDVRA